MKTIELTTVIGPDRKLVVQLPDDVSVGEHHITVAIQDEKRNGSVRPPLRFSSYDVGLLDKSMTFRREDLYDD